MGQQLSTSNVSVGQLDLNLVPAGGLSVVVPGQFTAIATVVQVGRGAVHAINEVGPVTFLTSRTMNCWRGDYYRNVNVLQPNDEIDVRGQIDASGQLHAVNIWANIERVRGTVTSISGGTLTVADVFGNVVRVELAPTVFFPAKKVYRDLAIGSHIDVVGLRDNATLGVSGRNIVAMR